MNQIILNSNFSNINDENNFNSKLSLSNYQQNSFFNNSQINSFRFDKSKFSNEDLMIPSISQMVITKKPIKIMSSEYPKKPYLSFSKQNNNSYESVQSSLPKNHIEPKKFEDSKYLKLGLINRTKVQRKFPNKESLNLQENQDDNDINYQELLRQKGIDNLKNSFFDNKSLLPNQSNMNLSFDQTNNLKTNLFNNPQNSNKLLFGSNFNLKKFSDSYSKKNEDFNNLSFYDFNDKNSSKVVSVSNHNSESSKPSSNSTNSFKNFQMFKPIQSKFKMGNFCLSTFQNTSSNSNYLKKIINKKEKPTANLKFKFSKEQLCQKTSNQIKSENTKILNTAISTTDNLSEEDDMKSFDSFNLTHEESWNTTGDDLIDDFLNQVKIINSISDPERICTQENDFDSDGFDENFYIELDKLKKDKNKDYLNLHSDSQHSEFGFLEKNSETKKNKIKIKQKWNYKMISLCKSVHFFDEKSDKIQCPICNATFTSNGMGGHMSKKHKNQSLKFKRRQKTTKFRKIIKKKNKQLKYLEESNFE
jgi:hypothetical protein